MEEQDWEAEVQRDKWREDYHERQFLRHISDFDDGQGYNDDPGEQSREGENQLPLDLERRLDTILRKLPKEERRAFRLYVLAKIKGEKRTQEECAEKMGLSRHEFQRLLYGAINRVGQELESLLHWWKLADRTAEWG